jgi:hypothetical protein
MAAALYVPREIEVLPYDSGEPAVVVRNNRRVHVALVLNSWRVDEEWWRDEISRRYFQIELKDGLVLTIFHDLVSGKWYQQRY